MTVEAAIAKELKTPTPFNDSRGRYYFYIRTPTPFNDSRGRY